MLLVRRRPPAGSSFEGRDRAAGSSAFLATGFAVLLGFSSSWRSSVSTRREAGLRRRRRSSESSSRQPAGSSTRCATRFTPSPQAVPKPNRSVGEEQDRDRGRRESWAAGSRHRGDARARHPRPLRAGSAGQELPAAEGGAPLRARRARSPRQGGARRVAALGARHLGAGANPPRPRRSPRGAGADAAARARPDPVRTDARVAVHVLPRWRLPHGGRPSGWSADRPAGSAVRGCPSVELRDLRRAGPEARLQPQRFRRDSPGPVRVGCEAPRCELRRPGPTARTSASRSAARS